MNKRLDLIKSIATSLFAICLSLSVNAQYKTKKYIKRNRKAPVVACGDDEIYARGLHCEGQKIFTGNSDGSMYYFNLEKDQVQLLFKQPGFTEMRDIERTGKWLLSLIHI